MGLDLVYSSGEAEHAIRISDAEWAYIDRLRDLARGPIDTLFNAPDFGETISVAAEELAGAVDAVLQLFDERPDLQPASYQWRAEFLPGGTQLDGRWNGGAMSGLRLPGDLEHFYMIRVGPEQCELEKMGVGPDGRGVVLGREDLRERDHLQTETVGRIDVRRRPAGAGLRKKLGEMRVFFGGLSGRKVSKVLC
jgi:hypothetical protein